MGPSPGFSRVLGQCAVLPQRTDRLPRFEDRRQDHEFPEFTHGIDEATGAPLCHTCDPD